MARRADTKHVALAAIETTPTSAAAAHGSHLPTGAGPGRGAALGVAGAASAHHATPSPPSHLPSSVQAKLLLLQGKLLRRDRTFLTWKWRDFYLEQHRLQYFSEKGVRKGEIVITKTTPITIRLLSEPKPFGFLLFIQDEKLTLAAATAQDRQKWIDVFTDVFHANVEDFQTNKAGGVGGAGGVSGGSAVGAGASGEKPEKKRTRPTFLPIPDMSEDEAIPSQSHHHHHHVVGGAKTPVTIPSVTPGTAAAAAAAASNLRTSFIGRSSEGTVSGGPAGPASPRAPANATSTTPAANAHQAGAAAAGQYHDQQDRRPLFRRNSEGTVVKENLVPRSKFIALKEHYSSVTFPRSLGNGDVLVGVGPLVRRMGWTDERILAVGLYVDADAAAKEMLRFHGRGLKSLRGDQAFYDYLVNSSRFRRSFVVTSRKRVSKSVLIALLHDEIAPRISGSTEALHTFLGFIEKSLRKAESMMIRIYPEGGRFEFRLRGQQYPPIASSMLCQCLQSVFFDVNSIQQDAKRRLVDRFPLLWGIEESEDTLHALGNSDRDLRTHELEPKHGGVLSESEDDDDDDDEDEDGSDGRPRGSTSADDHSHRSRNQSIKEKLDELDEREHELMRRESRSLGVHFGPIVDRDSNAQFRGDLLVDGSALLGTWSQKITYMQEDSADDPSTAQEQSCVVSVGLYAEPGGACEALLKYKGLSVGSILQDMDFFGRFADGAFTKHLVFKVDEQISVAKLVDYFTARVRRRGSGAGAPGGGDSGRSNDAKVRALFERLEEARAGVLRPEDEVQITILADSRMTLTINRQLKEDGTESEYPPVDGMKIASAPFSTIFQGIFYGYHTLEPASRAQLMERLPSLLDLAKDDLAHTYHDEIQVLRENYKRQLPEFRLKAGYMLIAFEKKKVAKNADGVKEQFITASKWSKRWCRLDGTTFSYFSHKRSKKPRDILDLTQCTISEITSTSTSLELAPFAMEKGARPSIRIGIAKRQNGEIVALKTESIYEGVEWLESLVEASQVVRQLAPHAVEVEIDQGAIETSGGGDADESSGALDDEVDDDTAEGHDTEPDNEPITGHSPYLSRSSSATAKPATDFKHGSLLAWIREDTRHATIFALLVFITWLITSQEPVLIRSAVAVGSSGDANSSFGTTGVGQSP